MKNIEEEFFSATTQNDKSVESQYKNGQDGRPTSSRSLVYE